MGRDPRGGPRVVHAARSGRGRGRGDGGGPPAPSSLARGFSRLDPATATYYEEATLALADVADDPEQAALLAGAGLAEAAGREVAVAADAVGSRALEALLPLAPPPAVVEFANAVLAPDALGDVATSQFGSHTVEALLQRLASLADAGDADAPPALAALAAVTRAAAAAWRPLATHRSGSHVMRALCCALAGRDVAPRAGGPGASAAVDGAAFLRDAKKAARPGAAPAGLAARAASTKQAAAGGGGPPAAVHPALVADLAAPLLEPAWEAGLPALARDMYGGPAVQALLRAGAGDDALLNRLIPRLLGAPGPATDAAVDGGRLAAVPRDAVAACARDRGGSHLLEAVLAAAPRPLRTELDARFLRGKFAELAAHPVANFVVQAALGAADAAPAAKGAARELAPVAGDLLAGSRGGVLVALATAARRVGAAEAEVGAAVSAAAAPLPGGRAAGLLTLGDPRADGDVLAPPRLSPVGCALLAALLWLPSGGGAPFADAVADLPPAALARAAADGAGSRAVEALFAGPCLSTKAVKRVLRKLAGRWAGVGATPGGVHVVERAYERAGAGGREAIAGELAAAEAGLGGAPRTIAMLRKCGVAEYKRSTDAWRRRDATGARARAALADVTGDARPPAAAASDDDADDDEPLPPPPPREEEADAVAAAAPADDRERVRKRGGRKRTARAAKAAAGKRAKGE